MPSPVRAVACARHGQPAAIVDLLVTAGAQLHVIAKPCATATEGPALTADEVTAYALQLDDDGWLDRQLAGLVHPGRSERTTP